MTILWFNYWIFNKAWYQGKIKMSAISKEKIKIRVLNKKSRHLDRMTRRSGTINVTCIYEYINRKTGGWRCSA
jgi:hypothetical protein